MHPRVVSDQAWRRVRVLHRAGILEGWTLAGGTGLALQFGHRVSEDFDFFRPGVFAAGDLLPVIAAAGPVTVQDRAASTLHLDFGGVRISFLSAQADLLFPGTPYRGLTVADPRDIAVMKIIAIGGRGSRKDFVDLFFCLRAMGNLAGLLALVRRRFAGLDYNEYHLLKSLVHFADAETEPMPRLLKEASWEEIKSAIIAEVKSLAP